MGGAPFGEGLGPVQDGQNGLWDQLSGLHKSRGGCRWGGEQGRGPWTWKPHPEGLEPPTCWFEASCSIQLSYGCGMRMRSLPPGAG